ncbi:protein mono-ADP-ribosyltransferase PARP9 isoform X1 [Oncorhynchus mykiss]|nr:protein mono-ADP-ribosyltransferase PARP9 isoform X1 [Oncorhynchus mykiss]
MVSILGQCGSALTNVLQSKFGCTTVLHGVDATCAGQSRKPSVFPEERFSIHLSNNRLKHCGGLAKALSDAGGPAIQQESDQYIFRKGKLSIGDAVIAPPGYLPCRKIIHAVGPNLPYNNRKSEVYKVTPQLQRAVLSILKVVKQDNLQSVAIPAISSGLLNYPLPLCADVIVKTLKEYHDSNYSGAPLEVCLVNHDEPSVREMERACRQILGSSDSHSQPVDAQGQPPKASYSQAARSHGKGSTKPFSTPTVQLGSVSLTIKKGYIEREQAFENQLKSLQGATQYSSPSNSAASQGKIPIKSRLRGFGHTTDHYESRATNERRYPRGGASPYIKLSSAHNDILREAKCWLTYAFMMPSENFTILNGFIQHFGQREFDKLLSLQTKWNVSIKEFFKDGRAGVIIQGSSRGVRASVLELEAIFCKVQEDFAKKEESDMGLKSSNNFSRTPVENNSSDDFSGLEIVRVEKVENSTLKHLFELKKRQLQSASSQRMYQRLPAQYCDLVSRVGFQREFAPPDEQNHGEGIYFSSSVHGTEKLWRGLADEEYLYFFAAQVLTGKSTIGTPGLIVPPETPGGDPLTLYDSVEGGVNTCHFQWSPGPT